jgi:hypothetical protein
VLEEKISDGEMMIILPLICIIMWKKGILPPFSATCPYHDVGCGIVGGQVVRDRKKSTLELELDDQELALVFG